VAFKPVTYVRGKDEVAVADSAARAVKLEFDGFVKQVVEEPAESGDTSEPAKPAKPAHR
jgi:hypothetical protein